MIIVKLQGGLGNQMFQYAAALSLADVHKTSVVIDTSFYGAKTPEHITLRQYELGSFNISGSSKSKEEITTILSESTNWKSKIFKKRTHYLEPSLSYDPDFSSLPANVYLEGYFQSHRYFNSIRNKLLSEYTTTESVEIERPLSLGSHSSVAVHVRRGDYVENPVARDFLGFLGLAYYTRALQKLKEVVGDGNLKVFIFSDDLKWCESNLNFEGATFVAGGSTIQDFEFMRRCDHQIISNSSYSWWAAWLNKTPNKQVIAPKRWFRDPRLSSKDLYPDTWIQL